MSTLLNSKDTAKKLRLTPSALRWHACKGHIVATQQPGIAGRNFFALAEIERFERERRAVGNPHWGRRNNAKIA